MIFLLQQTNSAPTVTSGMIDSCRAGAGLDEVHPLGS
jgi:hypothetical protein